MSTSAIKSIIPSPVKMEAFFTTHESIVNHLLSRSDVDSWKVSDIVSLADDECKALWDDLTLSYSSSKGHPLLVREIAALHGVSEADINVAAPQECIYIGIRSIVEHLRHRLGIEKIHVIVTSPAYQSLTEIPNLLGCDVTHWQAKPDTVSGEWIFDLDDFESLIATHTRLLVVNFPHNPTGYYPCETDWQAIISVCQQHNIFIFSDEIYSGTQQLPNLQHSTFCSHYDNAMTMCGMSKGFGMPGIRIGWLCCRNADVMKLVAQYKDYVSIFPPSPSQILALIGLRQRAYLLARVNHTIADNLVELEDFICKHFDVFEWHKPRAGTMTLVKFKGWLMAMENGNLTAICHRLAKEEGILLNPSAVVVNGETFVRIGYARKTFVRDLAALTEVLNKWRPK